MVQLPILVCAESFTRAREVLIKWEREEKSEPVSQWLYADQARVFAGRSGNTVLLDITAERLPDYKAIVELLAVTRFDVRRYVDGGPASPVSAATMNILGRLKELGYCPVCAKRFSGVYLYDASRLLSFTHEGSSCSRTLPDGTADELVAIYADLLRRAEIYWRQAQAAVPRAPMDERLADTFAPELPLLAAPALSGGACQHPFQSLRAEDYGKVLRCGDCQALLSARTQTLTTNRTTTPPVKAGEEAMRRFIDSSDALAATRAGMIPEARLLPPPMTAVDRDRMNEDVRRALFDREYAAQRSASQMGAAGIGRRSLREAVAKYATRVSDEWDKVQVQVSVGQQNLPTPVRKPTAAPLAPKPAGRRLNLTTDDD